MSIFFQSRLLTLIAVLLLGTLGNVYSQNLDSLKSAYQTAKSGADKIQILVEIGNIIEKQSLDSALYYRNLVLSNAEKTGIDTLMALGYSEVGDTYLLKGNFDISLDFQLNAFKIYQKYPEKPNFIKVLNSLGLIYFYQDKYDEALEYFFETDKLIDKLYTKDSEKSNSTRGRIYNNIGIIYDNTGKFDEALEYYSKAATHSRKVKDMRTLPSIYSNMGIIYLKTERYELAESIFKEAFDIRMEQKDNHGLCKSYFHLGSVYSVTGELELAKESLVLAISYCELANSMPGKTAALNQLATTLAEKGEFEGAYNRHLEYKILSDSLFNLETKEKLTQAEMQFNYEKEQQGLEAAQNRKELIYIIIATILVFGVISTITMFFLQKTKAKNQQLAKEKAEAEKETAELANKELSLRKKNLEYELEFKNKELTTNVMYLLKKNELISEITTRLVDLKGEMKKDNQRVIQKIIFDLQNAQDEDVWEEFETRFNQVYNDFYERLQEKFPNLTPSEKKICAFLRLNMTTKEISALTRQSYNSLNVARARLRKKLNLDNTETNLVTFLETV